MILITGGGTGGHLVIAKAIKEELIARGISPVYIGSLYGQDKEWFAKDSDFSHSYFLESKGVVNRKGLQKIFSLWHIFCLAFTCKALLKKHRIRAVFSVGGYSAAPAALAAIMSGIPLFIHEQNAIKGKLNTLLKPFAKAFFSSYDETAILTDYPVRESFFNKQRIRDEFKTIIFLGGSQGATFINTLAKTLSPILHSKGIKIIHQTGHKEFEALYTFYKEKGIPADVFDFTSEMAEKLNQADIAISRAGASTLWELCASGLPTLFIPFPYAAANHQYFNAKTLCDKGLALSEQQGALDAMLLIKKIESLDLLFISSALMNTIHKNGAKTIVEHLLHYIKESKC